MNNYDIDWADIIDMFASEYGWTVDYIVNNLDLGQVLALKKKIYSRHKAQNGEATDESVNSPNIEDNQDINYFIKEAGGKKNVREDGTVEIIV